MGSDLHGRRILLVEDEMLVSMFLEDALRRLGCEIVGPAARLAKAVELADAAAIDAAILDVNVHGEEVYPAAEKLAARDIPFAFVTGYRACIIAEIYRERLALQKPLEVGQVERALRLMLVQPSA